MIKLLLSLSTLLFAVRAGNSRSFKQAEKTDLQRFLQYTAQFSKHYETTNEYELRFRTWLATDTLIRRETTQDLVLGHNKFSDWTQQEKELVLNRQLAKKPPIDFTNLTEVESFEVEIPEEMMELFNSMQNLTEIDPDESDSTKQFSPQKLRLPFCPVGFRLSGKTCLKCPAGCKKCTSDVDCRSCMSNKFKYDRMRRTCTCFTGAYNALTNDCDICGNGQYYDKGCKSCKVDNCDMCSGEGECVRCAANFTRKHGRCSCKGSISESTGACQTCRDDQMTINGECFDCPANCSACNNFGVCTKCLNPSFAIKNGRCYCENDDMFLDSITKTCKTYKFCRGGSYNDGANNCNPCPSNCKSCNALTGICNICSSSTMEFLSDTSDQKLWHVDPVFKDTQFGQCRCPPRTKFTLGTCYPLTKCPDGQYNDGDGNCVNCAVGCATCTDYAGWCMTCHGDKFNKTVLNMTGVCDCPQGFLITTTGCVQYLVAPIGQYNNGENVLLPCKDNCLSCADKTGHCNQCVTSFTLDFETKQCACRRNQFINAAGKCETTIVCPVGHINDGQNTCLRCNSPNCITCGLDLKCTSCKDTYRYNSANDTCYCPYPQTFWQQSTDKCIDIIMCPAGQYQLGTNDCKPCGDSDCANCATDKYDWSQVCNTCKPTFDYNLPAHPNKCSCAQGKYKSASGTCVNCASNCARCSDGTGACIACLYNGYTLSAGVCSCRSGWIIQSDQTCSAVMACSPGQYNDGINNCFACPAANNCLECSSASVCINCRASYTLSSKRTNLCDCRSNQYESGGYCYDLINCGTGYYNNGYNSCYGCNGNCSSCTSATTCQSCHYNLGLNQPTVGGCACRPREYRYYDNWCYGCPYQYCGVCRDGDGWCMACLAFYTHYSYNGHCYCWAPSFESGGGCFPCDFKCTQCAYNQNYCQSCRGSFTLHYPGSYQCNCLPNQYIDASQYCQYCGSYQLTCASPTGFATSCLESFIIVNNVCVCPSNRFLSTSPTTGLPYCTIRTACPYTQYNRGDNVCLACPVNANCLNCDLVNGLVKCTTCAATFILDQAASTYGTCSCRSDQYIGQISGVTQCINCGTNMLTCQESTGLASTCKSNYSVVNGACTCTSNQYIQSGACHTCPSDCPTCLSNLECTSCVTNKVVVDGVCTCGGNQFLDAQNTCVDNQPAPIGFYNSGQNVMVPCSSKCDVCGPNAGVVKCTQCSVTYTLTESGTCACASGTFLDTSTQQCVTLTACPTGQVNDGRNVCLTCATNCTSCVETPTKCTSCLPTFTLNYPQAGQCACGQGYYRNSDNMCAQVPLNCSRANDVTGFCTNCIDTFAHDPSTGACTCPAQTAYNSTAPKCNSCPSSCPTCKSDTFCTSCKTGYIFSPNTGTCKCNATAIDTGSGCVAFKPCPDGQFNLGDNTCDVCDYFCQKCDDYTGRCNTCDSGYVLKAGSCNRDVKPVGRLLKSAAKSTQSTMCGEGCQECDSNQGRCIRCEKGFNFDGANFAQCTKECKYPVGPTSSDKNRLCLDKPFSEERVVPEFKASAMQVDWRSWNVVRPVQDQGKCGADYVYSTTAAAETTYAIKTGKLFDLSEQYLMDCDGLSRGCDGGWQSTGSYLLSTMGAVLEKDYPFVGTKQVCNEERASKIFKLEYPGSKRVESSKEAFKAALRKGPLTVSFKVSSDLFFQYRSGVIPASLCSKELKVNHSMVALGYGSENGVEYALVQNQWGTGWGEQGFFRVEMTDDESGPCGLYELSSYSLI